MTKKEVGEYEVTDRGIERVIAIKPNGYDISLVLPKEVFVEAYQRYIKSKSEEKE